MVNKNLWNFMAEKKARFTIREKDGIYQYIDNKNGKMICARNGRLCLVGSNKYNIVEHYVKNEKDAEIFCRTICSIVNGLGYFDTNY